MAIPQNPLDQFVSYAYHFELHAATSWDALSSLEFQDANDFTTATEPSGTLLINTRKDAHQMIDNVRWLYASPHVDQMGTFSAFADLTLTVSEPGGISFIEKLQNTMVQNQVTIIGAGLIFLLKIIFVGRDADSSITNLDPIILPLHLKDISADFNHRGGIYNMSFVFASAGALKTLSYSNNQIATALAYSNKNHMIKAKTVTEAIKNLQDSLNDNYQYNIKETVTDANKKIKYEINLDSQIRGNLDLTTVESFAEGDFKHFTFDQKVPIIDMIKRILMSSKEVCDMISSSLEGIKKEFHPNVKIPTISSRYYLQDSEAVIAYDVNLYTGRSGPNDGDFEFDYLFSDVGPSKNVDVTAFDVRFDTMIAWLNNSARSVALYTSSDATTPSDQPRVATQQTITPDRTYKNQDNATALKLINDMKSNDVLVQPGSPRPEDVGFVGLNHKGAQAARLAFETLSEAYGASRGQQTFDIRGHYNLLFRCAPRPDGTNFGFGTRSNGNDQMVWVKVNIRNKQGEMFYYTGYYQLLSVENFFSEGRFSQKLSTIMMDRIR